MVRLVTKLLTKGRSRYSLHIWLPSCVNSKAPMRASPSPSVFAANKSISTTSDQTPTSKFSERIVQSYEDAYTLLVEREGSAGFQNKMGQRTRLTYAL